MTEYIVTLEVHTPIWKKVLRFFRLIKQREDFSLILNYDVFTVGEILIQLGGGNLLILKRVV
jgi:hypothetical protein